MRNRMTDTIWTYKEAGAELGIGPAAISALVRYHGIAPKPVPRNGKAKGLDEADMHVLRRVLGVRSRRPNRLQAP